MNEIEFAALLVSRVCHDLVSPVGAVVNGLEVLEDERDATMRADALKLVTSSAAMAAARLQFARIAFGAAGSAGAELDLTEVGRMVRGLLIGTKVEVDWQAASANWPKDWAKLLMNATLLAADSLPRGGKVRVETSLDPAAPSFKVVATGPSARVLEEVEKALHGEPGGPIDGRSIQPYLTHKLARSINAGLTLATREGVIELVAG
jgi:histidine phosphotransferase ChpT